VVVETGLRQTAAARELEMDSAKGGRKRGNGKKMFF
jgi:hypothetical protein